MSRYRVIRVEHPAISLRVPVRPLVLSVALLVFVFVAICVATAIGEYPLSPLAVLEAVFGTGSHTAEYIVNQIRMPRIALGAAVGAALGLSGAIFQALARNALVSPDILGINEGAAVAAVAAIVTTNATSVDPPPELPLYAFAGAAAVALGIGAIALSRRLSMQRVVLLGIGVNAFLVAIVAYLITRTTELRQLQAAQRWLAGDLYNATWSQAELLAPGCAALLVLALALGRHLNALQLGPDLSTCLGVRARPVQLALIAIGALLAAGAVSVAGPIGFVAFLAPNIARRIARTASAAMFPVAALVGANLVLVADYAAKRLLEPTQLPVGILTILIGAPYFIYLLIRADRDMGLE